MDKRETAVQTASEHTGLTVARRSMRNGQLKAGKRKRRRKRKKKEKEEISVGLQI